MLRRNFLAAGLSAVAAFVTTHFSLAEPETMASVDARIQAAVAPALDAAGRLTVEDRLGDASHQISAHVQDVLRAAGWRKPICLSAVGDVRGGRVVYVNAYVETAHGLRHCRLSRVFLVRA